jgi:glycosyltransferase involved in cell wall biosynthesis
MMQVPNVCFLLYNLDPGGLENYLLRFIKSQGKDFKTTVILKSGQGGILKDSYLNNKVSLKFIKTGHFNIFGWLRIFFYFKKNKFDAVVDFTGNFAGIYLFLAKIAGVSNRVAYYGLSSNHFRETKLHLFYNNLVNQLVISNATRIISNSHSGFKFFFGQRYHFNNRFVVLPNGIESAEFENGKDMKLRAELGIPSNAFVLLHAGRNDPNKNHKTVIDVAIKMIDKYPHFFAILCGYNTEYLINIVDSRYRDNRILFLGYRDDIASLMGISNVFYFPSVSEGQPNALIEAMISGLPFIGPLLPEIKEFLPERFWDNLIDSYDTEGAIYKIECIMKDEGKVDEIKAWAIGFFDSNKRFGEFKELILSSN